MPVSPSDLLEPPFRFGECNETDAHGKVFCNAWAEGYEIDIRIRREGKRTTIYFPELLADCTVGTTTADCDVKIYLKDDLVEDDDFVIDNTATIQYIGSMRIYDDNDGCGAATAALVTYKPENATFRFEPITNFTIGAIPASCVEPKQVGILATEIEIIDEGEKAVIEVEEDIDMDYEEIRDDYANTEKTEIFDAACASWKSAHQNVAIKLSKYGNTGKIALPVITNPIKKDSKYGRNELYIDITKNDMLNFFNGYLPSGELTGIDEDGNKKKCWVKTYCTNTIDDNRYFRWVEGLIYHNGSYLKIVPNTEHYKFFNTLSNNSVASNINIGLAEAIEIEFEIQKEAPQYENLRADIPEFSLYKVYKELNTAAYCNVWATNTVSTKIIFYQYFNDDIPRLKIPETFGETLYSATETIDVIKFYLSSAETYDLFKKYMPSGYLQTAADIRTKTRTTPSNPSTYTEIIGMAYYTGLYLVVAPNSSSNHLFNNKTTSEGTDENGFYSFDILLPDLEDSKPNSYEQLRQI